MSQNKEADIEETLEKGYKEMADINLWLSQMCLETDNETLRLYEEKLTECE